MRGRVPGGGPNFFGSRWDLECFTWSALVDKDEWWDFLFQPRLSPLISVGASSYLLGDAGSFEEGDCVSLDLDCIE